MKRRILFLFGPLGAAVFAIGVTGLAMLVPGYSQVHQTVSEVGEVGSPVQGAFTAVLCAVSLCIFIFAWAAYRLSDLAGRSQWAAFLIGSTALSAAGVGVFSSPHPLHNVFGMSELLGFQAPLAMALTWRRAPHGQMLVKFSWLMFAMVWAAILLNLSSLDRHGAIWTAIKPYNGLAQRALFATWFIWFAGAGAILFRQADRLATR